MRKLIKILTLYILSLIAGIVGFCLLFHYADFKIAISIFLIYWAKEIEAMADDLKDQMEEKGGD